MQPVYEVFPGWEDDISAARSWEELPENARRYIAAVEELIDTHIACVSVGPERSQILFPTGEPSW